MKMRVGFVTNSSSTSYIIINNSEEFKDLVDLVGENEKSFIDLSKEEEGSYYSGILNTKEKIQYQAKRANILFPPGKSTHRFGNELGAGPLISAMQDWLRESQPFGTTFSWVYDGENN